MTKKTTSQMNKADFNPGAESLIVKGARTHNLKNITVEVPRNKMVVFTGLSGSGKSSLAFDTIFAEGQRRYVESLSSYARQFLRQMQKPDVDEISGLSPAISIDQKSRSNNPRSTVATITEIYDYLRVLFARIGHPHCLTCGREIKKLSHEEILETIIESVTHSKGGSKVMGVAIDKSKVRIYAPVVVGRKGEYYQMLYDYLGKGYETAKIDGHVKKLRERVELEKNKKHDIDILIDEFYVSEFKGTGKDSAKIGAKDSTKDVRERLSEAVERAIHETGGLIKIESPDKDGQMAERLMSVKFMCPYDGYAYPEVEPRLFSFNSPHGACSACNGLGTKYIFGDEPCETCKGARVREEALHVKVGDRSIVDVTNMTISEAAEYFEGLHGDSKNGAKNGTNGAKISDKEKNIAKAVFREIESRLKFMLDVGIEYLTLNRRAHTLSGGEAQRIRLASQLGSGLVGALYVLDEPTIGLHQRDNDRLIKTLLNLRDLGNTILVVEHDEDTIFASDFIVDIGPGAGVHGGKVVVADYLEPLLTAKKNDSGSLTLSYLRGETKIELPDARRSIDRGKLMIRGGNIFNIKNLDADIPLGKLVAVTGVSGSGKSSFLYEILHKNLQARLEKRHRTNEVFNAKSFSGSEYVTRTILIDQSPIGRTPRSNPATYTGAWTFVRELFAETAEARARGWKSNRFSFNVKGGRCETCQGNGEIAVEMHFLPTVYVPCEVCGGKRFTKETLEIKYKGKSVFDVLEMTVEEGLKFFEDIPAIYDRLRTLSDVGLDYLELGQSATTLSGGEAQRVKISSELYKPDTHKTVYLLDEPTVGLHYEDVRKLVEILQKLVDHGNTVVVIEHNLDLIKCADYIIDMGPEGGQGGGHVVAKGTPEDVAANAKSHTGAYLKKILKKK